MAEEGEGGAGESSGDSVGEGVASVGEGEASGGEGEASGGEGAAAPALPRGRRVRVARPPLTDLHVLLPRRLCTYGCGAMVWPDEIALCCKRGKAILGPEYNPPLDAEYLRLLRDPHFSHDSRLLNAALALGTQGVYPSRAMGGLGFYEQYYAHLALFGKTYLALYNVGLNNAFDNLLGRPVLDMDIYGPFLCLCM